MKPQLTGSSIIVALLWTACGIGGQDQKVNPDATVNSDAKVDSDAKHPAARVHPDATVNSDAKVHSDTKHPDAKVNPDAQLLADFKARVDEYVKLRNRLEKGRAELEETKDPAKIAVAEASLGNQLKAARSEAKPGDIFTPPIQTKFRRLLNPQFKGADGAENKDAVLEEVPGKVAFRVNAPYPKDEPLSNVPPDILKTLPQLPEDLEYRFVGKHMILRDGRANLIVDFIFNVVP